MGTLNESVLLANGIIFSEEKKEFYCSVCTDLSSNDWENHIITPRHVKNFERFLVNFDNHDTTFYCRICKIDFHWSTLRIHAITHKIVPWYKPDNVFETFFENQMLQWNKKFYCFACDAVLLDWSAAFIHIDGKNHKIQITAKKPANKSLILTDPSLTYKILIDDALISWESTNIACKICNCYNIGVKNVNQHVNGSRHSTARLKLILDLKARASREITAKRLSDDKISLKNNKYRCDCCKCDLDDLEYVQSHIDGKTHKTARLKIISASSNESKKKNQPMGNETKLMMGDNFIVAKSSTDFYCNICDCLIIDRVNIKDHVWGKRHTTGLTKFRDNKITFKGETMYYCDYCNCRINRLGNVFLHIDGIRHQMSLSKKQELLKTTEFSKIVTTKPKIIYNYIVDSNGLEYCKICDCPIDDNDDVKKHIKGNQHSNAWKKFLENKIIFKEGDIYRCNYCNCRIYGFHNVCQHMRGTKHINLLDESKEKVSKSDEIPQDLSSHSIVKSTKEDFACKICDCLISGGQKNIDEHFAGRSHALSLKKYGCENLSLKVTSESDEIPQDLSSHFIVKSTEEDSICEICDCLLNGSQKNIDEHLAGKGHASSLKKYGCKNLSLKVGTKDYYCKSCDCNVPGAYNLCHHVKAARHIKSIESGNSAMAKEKIANDMEISQNLSYNFIVKSTEEDSICKICDCLLKGSQKNIDEHLAGKGHALSLKKYGCENLSLKVTSESDEIPQDLSSHFIVKSTEEDSICKICDCLLNGSQKNIDEHLAGKGHASSLKKYGCKNLSLKVGTNDYYCKSCNCNVPGAYNLCHHVKAARHTKSIESGNSAMTKGKIANDMKISQNFSSHFIVKSTEEDPACKICDCLINGGQKNIDEHLAGRNHASSLKKYGCENLSLKVGTKDYYCKSCDCNVSGVYNLCQHVKGTRHAKSIESGNSAMTNGKIANDGFKPIIPPQAIHLRGTNKLHKWAPRRINNLRQRYVNWIWKRQIEALNMRMQCNVCGDKLENVVELHSHLAKHFNEHYENKEIYADDFETVLENGSLNSSIESLYSITSEIEDYSEECIITLEKPVVEPGRLERTPKRANMKRIVQVLDFEDDHIYSMEEKLRELELGMKMCFTTMNKKIYCMICQKIIDNTMQDYLDHLTSLDHCVYLEKMERDNVLFGKYPEEFSGLRLCLEYMEEISDQLIRCHICDETMDDADRVLEKHIAGDSHRSGRDKMHENAMGNFEHVKLKINCDWYKIEIYMCVPCSFPFRSEVNFVKHLSSKGHLAAMKRPINTKRELMIDFCEACAILWYGYRRTCAYHCDIETHLWLQRDGFHLSSELPKMVKNLLRRMENYVDETIKHYDDVGPKEREKENSLTRDIEKAAREKYPRAKAYVFGSRVTGVGTPNSDIDVFLDCGNMYDGKKSREDLLNYMRDVSECLKQDPETWSIEETLETCRSPIIKIQHRPTELFCDVSFENGLAVENTKLIKSFNDAFPPCRKMIIFLKQWMALCKLSGSDRITSYALYWLVIFYLQKELILPSVGTLITMKNRSHEIAGWQVGVARHFTYNKTEKTFGMKEFIARFFKFWANFDYRYDVASPIVGEIMKKRDFIDTDNLPKEMKPYEDYMNSGTKPDPLRIDSVMCIQDPIDLQHNITKAVRKVYVNRFRSYCSMSLDILYP